MQQSIVKYYCFVVQTLLNTNKPTTAENTSTSTFIRKPEAATAVWRAPDDGHCNARNMLNSVCTTKQQNFTIDCWIKFGVLFEWLKMHGTTNPKFMFSIFSNEFPGTKQKGLRCKELHTDFDVDNANV